MIVKRNGGMTEFIPSPQEKRDGLIRDHVLELVRLLHERVGEIEEAVGLPPKNAIQCQMMLDKIYVEETRDN